MVSVLEGFHCMSLCILNIVDPSASLSNFYLKRDIVKTFASASCRESKMVNRGAANMDLTPHVL